MKLLNATQIKEWDQYTIRHEPISSIDLMERASLAFVHWYVSIFNDTNIPVDIFCGNGNNGGDGLAIARMLRDRSYKVSVHILQFANMDSKDFDINLLKIKSYSDITLTFIHDKLPKIQPTSIIVDALMGTGANKPISGWLLKTVEEINHLKNKVVSVDMPSGLPSEGKAIGPAIRADYIFTFQLPKLSFFMQENDSFCPSWVVGDIGLNAGFLESADSDYILAEKNLIKSIYKPRKKFQHKGNFGHALIIAGSEGKIGAAILSTKACLKSGVGLVTSLIPENARMVMHQTVPEAMILPFTFQEFVAKYDKTQSHHLGIGPGLGTSEEMVKALTMLIQNISKPLVIDADALNIIAASPILLTYLPPNTILTPHLKEFERLFGKTDNETHRITLAINSAKKYNIIIILKGAYTRTITPHGKVYINTTGNPGMATAGSGDVLTGIITSLLAQSYLPEHAAIFGVYLHGLAGDKALMNETHESLIASDIIQHLGGAFKEIQGWEPN